MLKINISLEDGLTHFAYVPEQYILSLNEATESIKLWSKMDFGIELKCREDLDVLRKRVYDEYENRYPNIYNKNHPEKQGWLRVWYREHWLDEKK